MSFARNRKRNFSVQCPVSGFTHRKHKGRRCSLCEISELWQMTQKRWRESLRKNVFKKGGGGAASYRENTQRTTQGKTFRRGRGKGKTGGDRGSWKLLWHITETCAELLNTASSSPFPSQTLHIYSLKTTEAGKHDIFPMIQLIFRFLQLAQFVCSQTTSTSRCNRK